MKTLLKLFFFLILTTTHAYGLSVQLSPTPVTLPGSGNTFQIQVMVTGADNLTGFQFDIDYDPAIVTIQNNGDVTPGAWFKSTGNIVLPLGPDIDNTSGKLTYGAALLGANAGLSAAGAMAVITFTVTDRKAGTLYLNNVQIRNLQAGASQPPDATQNAALILSGSGTPDPPQEQTYQIAFSTVGKGSIDGNTSQTITAGMDTAQVTAVPEAGHRFISWSGDYTGTENPLSLYNINSDMTITALFEPKLPQQVYEIEFTVNGNGRIEGETMQTIPQGSDAAMVTAVPDAGYQFTGWTGDITSDSAALIITKPESNMQIAANFTHESITIPKYEVTFMPDAGGTIQGNALQQIEQGKNTFQVTAIPNEGYLFTGWYGDYTGSENPLIIDHVTANMTVVAAFSLKTYTITARAGAGGIIEPSGNITVQNGDTPSFVITPDAGYDIEEIRIDDQTVGASPVYQFPEINNNHAILATFVSQDRDGDGVPDSEDEFPDNAAIATLMSATGSGQITIDATATPGVKLAGIASMTDDDPALNQTDKPETVEFKDGLVAFAIQNIAAGQTVEVHITFPSAIPENAACYKVNVDGFYILQEAVFEENTVILFLTDGGLGDDDGLENREILDPVGVAIVSDSDDGEVMDDQGDDGGGGGCFINTVLK